MPTLTYAETIYNEVLTITATLISAEGPTLENPQEFLISPGDETNDPVYGGIFCRGSQNVGDIDTYDNSISADGQSSGTSRSGTVIMDGETRTPSFFFSSFNGGNLKLIIKDDFSESEPYSPVPGSPGYFNEFSENFKYDFKNFQINSEYKGTFTFTSTVYYNDNGINESATCKEVWKETGIIKPVPPESEQSINILFELRKAIRTSPSLLGPATKPVKVKTVGPPRG